MKKKYYFLLTVPLFLFIFYQCNNRIEAPPSQDNETLSSFGLDEAKAYFEANAIDLAPLRFNDSDPTKSSSLPTIDLIPEWDKALSSGHSKVSLIEVPVYTSSLFVILKKVIVSGKIAYTKTYIGSRRLIIARRSNGETEMFLATIIPLEDNEQDCAKNIENFRYLGGSDFWGQVFCSTLDGRFFKAFEYQEGVQYNKLQIMPPTIQPTHIEKNTAQDDYFTFSLQDILRTRATTYSFMEGPDPCCICGGAGCSFCLQNLDSANVISPCTQCYQKPCMCCQTCGAYPCRCAAYPTCSRCGKQLTNCICSRCPNCNSFECRCSICPKCGRTNCLCAEYPSGGGNTDPEICPNCKRKNCICCSRCHRSPCICCTGTKCTVCNKYINPTSAYCPKCTCIKINVSVNSTTIDLGEELSISVSCSNPSAQCTYIEYLMSKNGTEKMVQSFNSDPPINIKEMIRQPGEYKVSVEAQYANYDQIFRSNEVSFTCEYPNIYKIKELEVVQNGMNTAWENTLNAADASGYREYGGVVMIHTKPGSNELYTFEPRAGNKVSYDKSIVDIKLDCEEYIDGDFRNGGDFSVMIFHTHPPLWKCPFYTTRILGPSIPDLENHTTIPAIVYDFDNNQIPKYTNLTPSHLCIRKEYIYGPERKIN